MRLLRRDGDLRATAGLRRANQMSQSRFRAGGGIGMDRPLRSGPVELFGGQSQLRLRSRDIASGDCLANLANLRLDGRFDSPVLGPPLQTLAVSLLSALRVHSQSSVESKPVILLVG